LSLLAVVVAVMTKLLLVPVAVLVVFYPLQDILLLQVLLLL
jgi:hypothetical protein